MVAFLLILLAVLVTVLAIVMVPKKMDMTKRLFGYIIAVLAGIGLGTLMVISAASLSPQGFKPRLENYLLGKLSDKNDIVGRLTLEPQGSNYVAFPSTSDQKVMAIYLDGKLITADFSNGIAIPRALPSERESIRTLFWPR